MSDRLMRLKYLTKMKIILCIFLLCITAVSVFGEPQELNGIVGKSIEFPAAVEKDGSLMYSGVTIGGVTGGSFTRARSKFSSRLQWDSSTGLFSISGLEMEDSGEYEVQNTDQNINTVFQLNVYIPVSKHNVSITRNEYPCTIECTAERGTEATLSWYREGEKKPYVSSGVASAPHLHLPQTVERSGTYTCEAKNSVSNEKASITVGDHCTAPAGSSTGIIVPIFTAVVAVLIAFVFAALYHRIRRKHADVRRIIRGIRSKHAVKKLLDSLVPPTYVKYLLANMVPPAYVEDEKPLPSYAVKRIMLVKYLLDNMVPPAYVKNLLDNMVPTAYDEEGQALIQDDEDEQALIQDAVRRIILVKKLLNSLVPPAYAVGRIILVKNLLYNMVPPTYVKNLLDNMVPPAYDEDEMALIQDAVGKVILDGKAMVAFPPDDEDELPLIKDAVRRTIQDEDELPLIKDDETSSNRSAEPENGTPQARSYEVNPQPRFSDDE